MTRHPKQRAMQYLHSARECLNEHNVPAAQNFLRAYRLVREQVPASTLRRWRCGQ